ncbi:MAG: GHKL domain-containing protein [Synechococcaceae cyanobacterium SM2_3_1]|nr:GHKL domain-containing protein [Synechococcaceae cyanobacterium SM2_3_1]
MQRSLEATVSFSTKEERQLRRALNRQLEERGMVSASAMADTLVDMQVVQDLDPFFPLLEQANGQELLESIYRISGLQRSMRTIDTAVERAAKVVYALKSYARFDPSEQKRLADLQEGVETVLTLYQNQLKRGVEVVRHYAEIPKIWCYPDELSQVWTNIIHNALQAMENQGTLTIHTEPEDSWLQVRITDSGPGIPPEIQDKIFKPFFTTKPPGEGSGLGLDIVKRIIDRHQGQITVESQPGATTFVVSFPIQEQDLDQEIADPALKSAWVRKYRGSEF